MADESDNAGTSGHAGSSGGSPAGGRRGRFEWRGRGRKQEPQSKSQPEPEQGPERRLRPGWRRSRPERHGQGRDEPRYGPAQGWRRRPGQRVPPALRIPVPQTGSGVGKAGRAVRGGRALRAGRGKAPKTGRGVGNDATSVPPARWPSHPWWRWQRSPNRRPPGLGAPKIFPSEVAANRRRAIMLCAFPAAVPALVVGVALGLGGGVGRRRRGAGRRRRGRSPTRLWRIAPGVAPAVRSAPCRSTSTTTRACSTSPRACAPPSASPCPTLHIVVRRVPNACALGRDARRADLVVTSRAPRPLDPIELEGVIAHELAHVKRGDNGVSCIGHHAWPAVRGARRRCAAASGRTGSTEPTSWARPPCATRAACSALSAADDGGSGPGGGLGLRLAGPLRLHPLGLDRSVGRAPRRPRRCPATWTPRR